MAARRNRTRHINRTAAEIYLKKAVEFFESMRQASQAGRWNAVGLNAVHCAISACDAVLVYYTEERSADPDHEAAAHLLASLVKVPDAKQKAETLRRILHEKHLIEYEDRAVTMSEAAELAKLTERFCRWARELLQG
ncbi:MAG: HEPN domain-containing protein [Candidatus Omnitrophica bacterium]|nr:HEPN domain-containing protein [Candidatus Omnitrophota bacterium]